MLGMSGIREGSCARRDQERGSKEEVLTECPQILAALMPGFEVGRRLQKLVKLLLVTSIVRERTYHAGYMSVFWKTAPVI